MIEDQTRAATARVSSLVREAGAAAHRRMPNSEWTVADAAAHLVTVAREFGRMYRGGQSPVADMESVAEFNQRVLDEIPRDDVAGLADRLEAEFDDVARAYGEGAPDRPIRWHAGLTLPARTAMALALGELVIHGWDMAKALGRPWPIDRRDALPVVAAGLQVAPALVDKVKAEGLNGAVRVRLRGGDPVTVVMDDGQFRVEQSGSRKADAVVSADPVAMLLQSYGRGSKWTPVLTGKVVAYGRKPWLALRMQNAFRTP